ncbi:MAG: MFS transporter [Rhodospirillaceae bacterium]
MTSTPKANSAERPPGDFITDVPARLDRLPWDRFHWLVVTALGITWILDGLEVTLVGSLAGAINESPSLRLTAAEIGLTASAYLAGAVGGALLFGHLADRFGRKRLFTVTVGVYVVATLLTGLSWNFWSFALFRFLTGAGIGGEYAAINSAIQEFVPARWRGFVDLAVNGTFWLGAAVGAAGSIVLLDPSLFAADTGWRLAFVIGGLLGCLIIFLRRFVPESPRWLATHGRPEEAERIVAEIESGIRQRHNIDLPLHGLPTLTLRRSNAVGFGRMAYALFVHHRRRAVLAVTLMATQAFCYNAVFFTYALVLTKFYDIPAARVGWFILPFALGNLSGPLLLGRLFDTIGRKTMIAATYALAGALLVVTGLLFADGSLNAAAQTAAWTIIFFFASAGASAAYLTVGECFPLETRARAIAIFYAFGTAVGGISGPAVFGALIESGERRDILWGYIIGGGLMLAAAIVEMFLGISAERRPLEEIAAPLSCVLPRD